jgi:methylenetetrahydrofolate reductase (NADPH)
MTLRHTLTATPDFATIVELVPWVGEMDDPRGQKPMKMAYDLAGDPRITALSITDNAGGHARLSPDAPAEPVVEAGHDVIVHVACRDRNRNGLQSLGWDLLSRRLTTILAVTGDYPVEGYGGLSKPVFDIDSVGLLALFREIGEVATARAAAEGAPDPQVAHSFFMACAVDPVKRFERELIPQYLKLGLKVRSGAGFVITQVGYDARKQDELLRYMRREDLDVPAIANAYILDRGVARAFNAGRVPGCNVTDELLALVEQRAAGPDKGRAFFLEFAAKQLVVARGLGFRGIYLSGHRDATEIGRVLEYAEAFADGDWRDLVADVTFPLPGSFNLFERDPATGLNTDELNRSYRRSLEPAARRRSRAGVDPFYKVNRLLHERAFMPGTPGFRAWASAYERVERLHLDKPLHVLEQAVKVPLFDCRDCGDCSLPDVAYLCPESHCAKNQRNGPCGGSHDGLCEVPGHTCVWADAYRRLKPYGEELGMLDRPPVIQDNALRRTSAWANTFLRRDHFAKLDAVAAVVSPPAPAAVAAPSVPTPATPANPSTPATAPEKGTPQ